jgi:hypothetical protein
MRQRIDEGGATEERQRRQEANRSRVKKHRRNREHQKIKATSVIFSTSTASIGAWELEVQDDQRVRHTENREPLKPKQNNKNKKKGTRRQDRGDKRGNLC